MGRKRNYPSERVMQAREAYYAYLQTLYERYSMALYGRNETLVNLLPMLNEQEQARLAEMMSAAEMYWPGFVDRPELPPTGERGR